MLNIASVVCCKVTAILYCGSKTSTGHKRTLHGQTRTLAEIIWKMPENALNFAS